MLRFLLWLATFEYWYLSYYSTETITYYIFLWCGISLCFINIVAIPQFRWNKKQKQLLERKKKALKKE